MTELLARTRFSCSLRRRKVRAPGPRLSDPERLFWHLTLHRPPNYRTVMREIFGPMLRHLQTVLVLAPVMEAGGTFQLHPDPRGALPKQRRWIFAVREGYGSAVCGSLFGDIVDLVAVDCVMERPTSRLLGLSPVLGYPQDPSILDQPVRVFATVWGWITGGFDGVVLIGDRAQQQSYLRNCPAGIIADDLVHAEALQLKLRRDVPELPKLFVADAR